MPLVPLPVIDDARMVEQEARMERLEQRMRPMRVAEGQTTQYDIDGVPVASLPPNIPRFGHKREGESNQYYLELILRIPGE